LLDQQPRQPENKSIHELLLKREQPDSLHTQKACFLLVVQSRASRELAEFANGEEFAAILLITAKPAKYPSAMEIATMTTIQNKCT
jgi:hypothetical protein